MKKEECFFMKCNEPIKCATTFSNGTEIATCEKHENIWYEEFVKK